MVIAVEDEVGKKTTGKEEGGSGSFGADDVEKAERGNFGFGIFTKSVMVENGEDAGRELQKDHNKHRQNNNS